jgi:hypothetical protein
MLLRPNIERTGTRRKSLLKAELGQMTITPRGTDELCNTPCCSAARAIESRHILALKWAFLWRTPDTGDSALDTRASGFHWVFRIHTKPHLRNTGGNTCACSFHFAHLLMTFGSHLLIASVTRIPRWLCFSDLWFWQECCSPAPPKR